MHYEILPKSGLWDHKKFDSMNYSSVIVSKSFNVVAVLNNVCGERNKRKEQKTIMHVSSESRYVCKYVAQQMHSYLKWI